MCVHDICIPTTYVHSRKTVIPEEQLFVCNLDDIASIYCLNDMCQFSVKFPNCCLLEESISNLSLLMSYNCFLCPMKERAVKQFRTKYFILI